MPSSWGDIYTFLHDTEGRIYRYWVYKRVFTPLEMEKKYVDQGEFADSTAMLGVIKECVDLGNGDYLLGFTDPDSDGTRVEGAMDFYRLSEIRLAMYPSDQPSHPWE